MAFTWRRPAASLFAWVTVAACALAGTGLLPAQAPTTPPGVPSPPAAVLAEAGATAQAAPSAVRSEPHHHHAVEGSIADTSGALIPAAHVTLRTDTPEAPAAPRLFTADAEGRFRFEDLPAGDYAVLVEAPGFAPFTSRRIVLRGPEPREVVEVRLPLPAGHADAEVTLTRHELATEELHAAEKQRVLGIFPNFYTSFVWNAEPLDSRQKFALALRATTDPVTFFTAGVVAGGEQLQNTFPDWGSGPGAFGKRYGAAYADAFSGKILGSALLPSLLHQDPRYFYMGTGGFRQRLGYVLASGVITRGDNGRPQPGYSHVLGNAAAGALSTVYHPSADSAGKLALDNALIGIAGEAAVNFCREFLLKPFTRGIQPATQ